MSSEVWFTILVAAVGLERLAELVVSKRNATWSLERGGVETGQGHYPFMVVLHTGLLAGMLVEVWLLRPDFLPLLGFTMLALAVASQGLRWWCIATLGHRWNTRVIVVPGLPLVSGGPYRWFAHPNYVAVVVEGVVLPLVHTAWLTAVVFTVCNAVLLMVRLRVENRALRAADRPRPRPSTEANWAAWGRINMPTLLLRGALSDVLDADIAARMVREHPACRFIEIPGSGHSIPLEAPIRFREAVQTFL